MWQSLSFKFSACCCGKGCGACRLSTAPSTFDGEAGGVGNKSVVWLIRKARLAGITSKATVRVCEGDNVAKAEVDVIGDKGGGDNTSVVRTLRKTRLAGIT